MLANYEVDLHGHTNRSDGNDTPREFIDHAAERGLKIVAITDHDVVPPDKIDVDGRMTDAAAYAASKGLQLIRGIEISCETNIDDVHLVCFGCDWNSAFFSELSAFSEKSKVNSYKKLVAELNHRGWNMSWDEVLDNDGHPVTEAEVQKKMIFELMARKGYMRSWGEAKLYVKNKIDIKRDKPQAVQVIKKIKKMGGMVILAHPYLIAPQVTYEGKMLSRDEFIEILIDTGLDGIEASYTYDKTSYDGGQTKEQIRQEVIRRYGDRLFISGGSDYHADGKKGVSNPREIGECGITLDEFMKCHRLSQLVAAGNTE